LRRLFDTQVFDIASSEHDVFVDIIRAGNLVVSTSASFGTVGDNLLQRDGAGFRIDLMKRAYISALRQLLLASFQVGQMPRRGVGGGGEPNVALRDQGDSSSAQPSKTISKHSMHGTDKHLMK
jgi:hypothetical protein